MKSKGLSFPDNLMDIFGFHREEEIVVDEEDYFPMSPEPEDEFDDPDWEKDTMDSMYPEGYDFDVDGYPVAEEE
jgi:hypothetical protein